MRRPVEELARISELVWTWRLARWVEERDSNRRRLEAAQAGQPPTEPRAVALWHGTAVQRRERLQQLQQALDASDRAVAAVRGRLRRARARRRAAGRLEARRSRSAAEAPGGEVDMDAWLARRRRTVADEGRADESGAP